MRYLSPTGTPLLGAHHGEGPVWAPTLGGLCWVDMLAGDVLISTGGTAVPRRVAVGEVAALVRPRRPSGSIVVTDDSFLIFDGGTGEPATSIRAFNDPSIRFNEGTVAPDGTLLCGTMAYDQRRGAGALYRLDSDGRVDVLLRSLTISNGIAFGDDEVGYFVDSPTQRIDRIRYDPVAGIVAREEFIRIPESDGMPDGICLDSDGAVWVALWGGSAVRRYTPDGNLDAIVRVPVPQVTACTFGGEDLATLFITTSGLGTQGDEGAGAVYSLASGERGSPTRLFGGS